MNKLKNSKIVVILLIAAMISTTYVSGKTIEKTEQITTNSYEITKSVELYADECNNDGGNVEYNSEYDDNHPHAWRLSPQFDSGWIGFEIETGNWDHELTYLKIGVEYVSDWFNCDGPQIKVKKGRGNYYTTDNLGNHTNWGFEYVEFDNPGIFTTTNSGTTFPRLEIRIYAGTNDDVHVNRINVTWKFENNRPEKPQNPIPTHYGRRYAEVGNPLSFKVLEPNDPDGDNVKIEFNWGDGEKNYYNFLYGETHGSHSWSRKGIYNVKIRAVDIIDEAGPWASTQVKIGTNNLPTTPSIAPVNSARIGKSCTFKARTVEDKDIEKWQINWDFNGDCETDKVDDNNGNYYTNGDVAETTYVFNSKGSHTVRAQAEDIWGGKSPWSNPMIVLVSKTKEKTMLNIFDYINDFPLIESILNNLLY